MKKIYEKHFRVLENEKIKDHVMKVRVLLAVAIICVSLASMGITAYAFFSCTVTSSNNIIKAAYFKLDKTVLDGNVEVPSAGNGVYTLSNTEGTSVKQFQLKLVRPTNVTASEGFAKIEIRDVDGKINDETYYTDSITRSTNIEYSVHILVPAGKSVSIRVVDNWGTCAKGPVIGNNGEVRPAFGEEVYIENIAENQDEVKDEVEDVPVEEIQEEEVLEEVVPEQETPEENVPEEENLEEKTPEEEKQEEETLEEETSEETVIE